MLKGPKQEQRRPSLTSERSTPSPHDTSTVLLPPKVERGEEGEGESPTSPTEGKRVTAKEMQKTVMKVTLDEKVVVLFLVVVVVVVGMMTMMMMMMVVVVVMVMVVEGNAVTLDDKVVVVLILVVVVVMVLEGSA